MGNCIRSNTILNLSSQFIDCYILDKQYNIIIGIYSNSNTMINQGICIGYNNNTINKIKFGIIHRHCNKVLELFFEDNIKLILTKINNCENIKLTLIYSNNKIEKNIDSNLIKKFKLINNNSEYIDMIFKIIN